MGNDFRDEELIVFRSKLGWIALRMRGSAVRQLSFGHGSAAAATRAIAPVPGCVKRIGGKMARSQTPEVVQRLERYAEGAPDDFRDLPVDSGTATEFQARVLKACREIPYGQTLTYGELAARAGARGCAGRGELHGRQPRAVDHSLSSCRAGRGRDRGLLGCGRECDQAAIVENGGCQFVARHSFRCQFPGRPRQTHATWAKL